MNRSGPSGSIMSDDEDLLPTNTTTIVTVDTELTNTRQRLKTDTSAIRDAFRIPRGVAIGDYTVGRHIGAGDSGSVYAARHNQTGGRAALKVLYPDRATSPRLVQWFTRELETLSTLRHPNIIEVYDIGQLSDGQPYYVMELLTGMSLREFLDIHGRLDPLAALELFDPICHALQAAHGAGVIHGNLKSNNIMVVDDAERRVVKVLDFALSRLAVVEPGPEGVAFIGSAEAAAPEQLRGQPATVRSDIYGLGVLLFQLLTGEYPFGSYDEDALVQAHLRSSPLLPSKLAPLSQAIDSLVLRCLEKVPNRRFDSVLSLQNALHRALAAEKQSARDTPKSVVMLIRVQAAQNEGDETVHNAILREVMMFLDNTEDMLREAGFAIASNVTDGILGVTPLPADDSASAMVCERAVRAACNMYREIEERTISSAKTIDVSIALRIDARISGATVGEVEIPGDVLKEIPGWAAAAAGIYAMPELFAGWMAPLPAASASRAYIEIDHLAWV